MISRRSFIRKTSAGVAAGLVLGHVPGMATPVADDVYTIPIDKQLDPSWVKSLYSRGVPTVYTKSRNELRYIGMPCGGINAGGVYLGGDGRLWLWDIFNDNREGVEPKMVKWVNKTSHGREVVSRDGACYLEPAQDIRPLEQGFALRFQFDGKTIVKYLTADDWDEIEFEAGYPVGVVRYTDKNLPVEVMLHGYSPFIPLNADDSGLPATVLSFSFQNKGSAEVKITVAGWLENKTMISSADRLRGPFGSAACRRYNMVVRSEGWVAVDESVFTPDNKLEEKLTQSPDFGTMCIAAFGHNAQAFASTVRPESPAGAFSTEASEKMGKPVQERLIGRVCSEATLPTGGRINMDFVIAWYFPNLKIDEKIKDSGRYYQNRFASALGVAAYIHQNFERLSSQTLRWAATWKDSTLPHWFLERTFMNIDTLATTTCHRFNSGRFWAWEGVGACHGTCTHVWQYAQAMGRIFPALERDCRERTDLGIAMQDDGGIIFRAEMETRPAIDGQGRSYAVIANTK